MKPDTLPRPLRRIGEAISSRLGDAHLAGVVRGAAFVMGIRVAGAAIALLSQVLLARWMGAFEYGIFAYVWVWVVILGIVVPMGFGTSVLRFVPEYRTKERW
ncbi:MAG: oligosaccharide flippase family protein, partial [Parvibaculum sp.]|nr:oligosaccharide flippase family protein [Parvibaculum sp.]